MAGRALLLGTSLVAGIGALVWASGSIASRQMCKPVVPKIEIDAGASAEAANVGRLFILYDERGGAPTSQSRFAGSPRLSSCTFEEGRCIASRARYEVRPEPERYQSIQIRRMGGVGDNLLGAVRWKGPAYPEKVAIACDFSRRDLRRSCRLTGLGYTPDPDADGLSPGVRMHDKCRP